VTHVLPTYETPLVKSDFQSVKTTAYTHTESDHRQYGARNALGGELHAAGPAIRRAENTVRITFTDVGDQLGYERIAYSGAPHQPFSMDEDNPPKPRVHVTTHSSKSKHPVKRGVAVAKKPPKIGSAAADWSRWPAGTTFRLISTGQMYRVEDYGWALAGRNTIDLYMPNQREMNSWGAREEPIQILHWGDPNDSLRVLLPRQQYKHVRRMVLELQGNDQEAAALH
jgi:3D (Asp-Asp-Asp) domain-containing protein